MRPRPPGRKAPQRCWVISFDQPDVDSAPDSELLTRLLSRFPGRGNRVEESGFHTSDAPRAGAVGTTGARCTW